MTELGKPKLTSKRNWQRRIEENKGNEREIDLLNCEKLSGIEIHSHVNLAEGAASDQLALAPSDHRGGGSGVLAASRRGGTGEDSGVAHAGIDFVDKGSAERGGEGGVVLRRGAEHE